MLLSTRRAPTGCWWSFTSCLNPVRKHAFPWYGWAGILLVGVFWYLNWSLDGLRTHWGFFPLWHGYCLVVDSLVVMRRGTSLLQRSWRRYLGLFLVSALVWWLFEALNAHLQNWKYLGVESFSNLEYAFWATLSFSTVIPAVFGSAELASTISWLQHLRKGPIIRPDRKTTIIFFVSGWVMLFLMWMWPKIFFPFVWISIYFILEPLNIWWGNRHLASYTATGDWRPVMTLWIGVLITALFWEMWNFYAFPKWEYHIPWADCCHLFEMPLLGYGGYLPFALELFAFYHFVTRCLGGGDRHYLQFDFEKG